MFLSANGDVEVGLQAPRKLGEPTRSTQPQRKCAFLIEATQNQNFILFNFSSRLSLTSRHRVRIVSLEKEAFCAPVFPCLLSFSFFLSPFATERLGETRTARTVGALPSV